MKFLHDVHDVSSTPTGAVEFAKQLEPYRMFYVEDILPPEQIEWFRRIKQVDHHAHGDGRAIHQPARVSSR